MREAVVLGLIGGLACVAAFWGGVIAGQGQAVDLVGRYQGSLARSVDDGMEMAARLRQCAPMVGRKPREI